MKMSRAILLAVMILALAGPADAGRFKMRVRGIVPTQSGGAPAPLIPGVTSVGAWAQSDQPTDIANAETCPVAGSDPCRQSTLSFAMVQYVDIAAPSYVEVLAHQAPSSAEYALGTLDGISGVRINCDNGSWIPMVYEENATGHMVWRLPIDPANFTDGYHECRARSEVTQGRSMVAQGPVGDAWTRTMSFFFSTNNGATLPATLRYVAATGGRSTSGCGVTSGDPCDNLITAANEIKSAQSNDVGGGIACLLAGNHTFGNATNPGKKAAAQRWMTVEPCSGVTRAQAVINADVIVSGKARGIGVEKLRLHNITTAVTMTVDGSATKVPTAAIYFDDVVFNGALNVGGATIFPSMVGGVNSPIWGGGRWYKGGDYSGGYDGPRSAVFSSDLVVHGFVNDLFNESHTILGATVTNHDRQPYQDAYPASPALHPDLNQYDIGLQRNVILEGIVTDATMKAQGTMFSDGSGLLQDFALVGNTFVNSGYIDFQWAGYLKNGFLKGNTFTGSIALDSGILTISEGFTIVNNTCSDTDWNLSAGNATASTFLGNTGCAP